MTNNTATATETKTLTGYQQLFLNLNDDVFAREFTKRQTERAQELIAQILMVTSGVSEVTGADREWGHANFLELLDIFQIQHANFSRSDLAEDLQSYVYTFSLAHGEAYRQWKQGHYHERGLNEDGLEKATACEDQSAVLDLSAMSAKDLETDDLDKLASQLSGAMSNPLIPERLYNAIADEMTDLLSVQVNDSMNSPAAIAEALKLNAADGGQNR